MNNVRKHFDLLGRNVKDKVTGYTGTAVSVCFDLYGCIQVAVNPGVDKDNKLQDSHWFDVDRLKALSDPVMLPPNYDFGDKAEGKHGPAEKPSFSKS